MPQAESPTIATFKAWVWVPDQVLRSRGFATATLTVLPQRFLVEPTRLGARSGSAAEIDYDWPTVIIERHRPIPDVGLLVEIDGKLGRVAVRARFRAVDAAMRAAGFRVVVVRHRGWEAPSAVRPDEATLADAEVPSCVRARR